MEHNFHLSPREAYTGFYDFAWAKSLTDRISHPAVNDHVFDLLFHWRGTSNTFRMPWLTCHLMAGGIQSALSPDECTSARTAKYFADDLLNEFKGVPLAQSVQAKLRRYAGKVAKKVDETKHLDVEAITEDQVWDGLIPHSEFQISINAAQRLCYADLYFGYENFLLRLHRILSGDEKYQIVDAGLFGKAFSQHLRRATVDKAWTCRPVAIARQIRIAVVHGGCRMTPALRKFQDLKIKAIDDHLVIRATDVRELFEELRTRVDLVAMEVARILPN